MPSNNDGTPILEDLTRSTDVEWHRFEEDGDSDREVTVDEYYHHSGFGVVNIIITLGAGMAVFMYSTTIQWLSLVARYMECVDNLTDENRIGLAITLLVGILIGLPLSGMVSDRIGRRVVALAGVYVITSFWIMSAISTSLLAFGICIVGIGFGILLPSSIVFGYEFSSVSQHTRVTLILFGMYIIGAVYTILLYHFAIKYVGWHWLMILIGLPLLLLFLFYHLSPDSPKFLAISGRADHAYIILLKLHVKRNIPMMRGRLKSTEITERGRCCTPCSTEFVRPTILLSLIFVIQSFVYYTLSYGLIVSFDATGYCDSDLVYSKCNQDTKMVLYKALLALVPDFVGLLAGMFLAETAGRRASLMLLSFVGAASCLTALYCLGFLIFTVEIAVARGCAFGTLVTLYMYTVEIYTTNTRCIAFSYLWGAGIVGMIIAGILSLGFVESPIVLMLTVGAVGLLGLIPMYFLDKVSYKDVDDEIEEQASLNNH